MRSAKPLARRRHSMSTLTYWVNEHIDLLGPKKLLGPAHATRSAERVTPRSLSIPHDGYKNTLHKCETFAP